ncbi:MAG: hypothetical protein A2V74_09355 [Acidobacteria bacterium RBG_16_70_10]|nr:MAG: hypothetical protein A2V74_09355 [Acidobacteria bacterium RBG_16_70_10]
MGGWLDVPGRRLVAGAPRVLGEFGIGAGQTVVEIGPGTGFYSVEAARRIGPSGRLLCVDLQREMLEVTRGRVHVAGLRAHFVRANASALPLRPGSADHVFLVTVLGEIPDRPHALAEMKRVLRRGGRLSVCEQFPDPDFVTPASLRRDLSTAGFVEERTRGWLFYRSTWSAPR